MVLRKAWIRGISCIAVIGLITAPGCADQPPTTSAPEPNVGPAGPPGIPAPADKTPAR